MGGLSTILGQTSGIALFLQVVLFLALLVPLSNPLLAHADGEVRQQQQQQV